MVVDHTYMVVVVVVVEVVVVAVVGVLGHKLELVLGIFSCNGEDKLVVVVELVEQAFLVVLQVQLVPLVHCIPGLRGLLVLRVVPLVHYILDLRVVPLVLVVREWLVVVEVVVVVEVEVVVEEVVVVVEEVHTHIQPLLRHLLMEY